MDAGNYVRHFGFLGKLCFLYDNATAAALAQNTLLATTADQVADGTTTTLPGVEILARNMPNWVAAISAGATSLQNQAMIIASAYLVDPTFTAGLTTVPTATTPLAVLTALATEMTSVDNKTLGTKTTSGLVNFFDTIAGATLSFNTESDSTADYRDATYVVSAVV